MSYSEARANFASTLDAVERDHEEIVITRGAGREQIVMLSFDDYQSMRETLYLLSGANGRVLRRSIAELRGGEGEPHDLIEPDAAPAA